MLLKGDCLDQLKGLSADSIDSLITDPPAGISFMGKDWDKDKGGRKEWIAWMSDVMRECMRVMKPGAHGLVWAIPRTSHWTATALEDAGFEVRDVVTHLFGSGFPKSLDISKAIDKAAGAEREKLGPKSTYRKPQEPNGWDCTKRAEFETAPATDEAKQWQGWGTALKPSNERWILCRKPLLSEKLLEKTDTSNAQEWDEIFLNTEMLWKNIWDAVLTNSNTSTIKTVTDLTIALKTLKCSIFALTQVITTLDEIRVSGELFDVSTVHLALASASGKLNDLNTIIAQGNATTLADISAELIKMWQKQDGELSLEPFAEDYILIRKPCSEKTVAANVLKHGVGGINIDASRIGTEQIESGRAGRSECESDAFGKKLMPTDKQFATGRFPANLLLSHTLFCEDECTEDCPVRLLDEQSGDVRMSLPFKKKSSYNFEVGSEHTQQKYESQKGLAYKAPASRFFYCAKASKRERNAGLEGMPEQTNHRMMTGSGKVSANMERFSSTNQNHHPTVKPQKLMEYLIKLITPPNGVVLDPFMGSGSTGVAAKNLGFGFIGIEREQEYFEIAARRIG